jgi:predicted ATPase
MPTNALDYITIQGFKSIASIEKLALRPINVVIGPNGSSKSNFIGVFEFLHEFLEHRLDEYVRVAGGAERILHFGSKATREIVFGLLFAGGEWEYRFRPTADDGLYHYRGKFDPGFVPLASLTWRIHHFNDTSFSSPIRKTAKVDDNRFLRADGANLPAFLYLLRERHKEESYDLIVRTVQGVAPFFDDFQLAPRGLESTDIRLEWRHKRSDQYFDASSLSDGTLRFIALATLFLQPEQYRPSIILVDEPELGLHPYAIEMLAALVRQASVTTQVIVSTQSSLLLDHFQPEDVLVADAWTAARSSRALNRSPWQNGLKTIALGSFGKRMRSAGGPFPADVHGSLIDPCGRPDRRRIRKRSASESPGVEGLLFRRGSHCRECPSPSTRWNSLVAIGQKISYITCGRIGTASPRP